MKLNWMHNYGYAKPVASTKHGHVMALKWSVTSHALLDDYMLRALVGRRDGERMWTAQIIKQPMLRNRDSSPNTQIDSWQAEAEQQFRLLKEAKAWAKTVVALS